MNRDDAQITKELIAIKRLLILALLNSGMTQSQVASAMDIDRSSVSRMFPKGALSGAKKKGGDND